MGREGGDERGKKEGEGVRGEGERDKDWRRSEGNKDMASSLHIHVVKPGICFAIILPSHNFVKELSTRDPVGEVRGEEGIRRGEEGGEEGIRRGEEGDQRGSGGERKG